MLCRQIIVLYCPRFSCNLTKMGVRKPVGQTPPYLIIFLSLFILIFLYLNTKGF